MMPPAASANGAAASRSGRPGIEARRNDWRSGASYARGLGADDARQWGAGDIRRSGVDDVRLSGTGHVRRGSGALPGSGVRARGKALLDGCGWECGRVVEGWCA